MSRKRIEPIHVGIRWARFFDAISSDESTGGSGSGIVLSEDGEILTNNHVVEPAGEDGELTVYFDPPQNEARSANVDWPSPTLPLVAVGYHGPAYSDTGKDKATCGPANQA